jgi:hypothetical protein
VAVKVNSTPAPFTKFVKGCGTQELPSGSRVSHPPDSELAHGMFLFAVTGVFRECSLWGFATLLGTA